MFMLQIKLWQSILSQDKILMQKQEIANYMSFLQFSQHLIQIVIVLQVFIEKVILTEKEENLCRLLDSKKIEYYLWEKSLEFLLSWIYMTVVIKEKIFYNKMSEILSFVIHQVQQENIFASQWIKKVQQTNQINEFMTFWRLKQDSLFRHEDVVYISSDSALKQKIICLNHNNFAENHLDIRKILNIIHQKYFWDKMLIKIIKYKKTCDVCQYNQTFRHCLYDELQLLKILMCSWKIMTLNFIMRLLFSRWNDQVFDLILICVDAYIKTTHYFSCHKIINMSELTILLIDNIATWYEMSKNLINDCASLFISKFWSILCYYLKMKYRFNTAFHSQTDEQTEH